MQNMIDMDDPSINQEIKNQVDVTLDITDGEADKLNIHVRRNETLAKQQKELRSKILEQDKISNNTDRLDYNVIVFYYDNLARANMRRKLPKTHAWFNQFGYGKSDEYLATQYFRYHTQNMITPKNSHAILYGAETSLLESLENNVYHYYKENGYVTARLQDECVFDDLRKVWNMNREGSYFVEDHNITPFLCDVNFDYSHNNIYFVARGPFAEFRQ